MEHSPEFEKIVLGFKELLPESISKTIAGLKERMLKSSSKFNDLILFESRLSDADAGAMRDMVSNEELQIAYNKIRTGLLAFIDSLAPEDLTTPESGPAETQERKMGCVEYAIPNLMQLEKTTRCMVRIAWDDETIKRILAPDKPGKIESIQVSDVMEVEMVDFSGESAFTIQPINAAEQRIDEGELTTWQFNVKPLIEGTFPLTLKIAVIEPVNGKERKREIVLEENIQIVAVPVAEKETGAGGEKAAGVDFKPAMALSFFPVAKPVFKQQPRKMPSQPSGGARSIPVKNIVLALVGAVLIGIGIWFAPRLFKSPDSTGKDLVTQEIPQENAPEQPAEEGPVQPGPDDEPTLEEPSPNQPEVTPEEPVPTPEEPAPTPERPQPPRPTLPTLTARLAADELTVEISKGVPPYDLVLLKGGSEKEAVKVNSPGARKIEIAKYRNEPGWYDVKVVDSRNKEASAKVAVYGSVNDPAGQSYPTFTMQDGKVWMMKNLSYAGEGSWCYENTPSICATYGRLYTWEAAQKACKTLSPGNWRLPSDSEWKALAGAYGGGYYDLGTEKDVDGDSKKSYSALVDDKNAGFHIQMGGYRLNENYYNIRSEGAYWSGTELTKGNAFVYTFVKRIRQLRRDPKLNTYGNSCRCIRD
jgi:uncharacterized protein (TIGR02145 family)